MKTLKAITAVQLYQQLQQDNAPTLLDVRRIPALQGNGQRIVGSLWKDPEQWLQWKDEFAEHKNLVVYCAHGHELGQGMTAALQALGAQVSFLEGGMTAWKDSGLPSESLATKVASRGLWVTRARPKIDRIACPWLIRRFVDANAEFLYVTADEVMTTAQSTGAIPFDVPGAKFGHDGDRCSFDAIIKGYGLTADGLDKLATIVRAADTDRLDLAPQASGLLAISRGLSSMFKNDHEMLRAGMLVYDALYADCQSSS